MKYEEIVKNNERLLNMNERFYSEIGAYTWDTNVYLIDKKEMKRYFIDNGDIIDEEYPEEGLVHWNDLVNLENISELKEYSWKTEDLDYIPYWDIKIISTN